MSNRTANRFYDCSALELKSLETQIEADYIATQRKLSALGNDLKSVREVLRIRTQPAVEPRLSDHALLRFIERSMGLDVEAIRAKILNAKITDAINAGASAVSVDGVKMIVKDKTIVTIVDRSQ